MTQFDADYIDEEFEEIGKRCKAAVRAYLIGGCAMSFRKLKETTKDADVVFDSRREYLAFCGALFGAQYVETASVTGEHDKLESIKMYENAKGFHLDLFVKKVCGKMHLSSAMMKRAELHKRHGNLEVFLLSKEDVFLFKTLASESRTRDLIDLELLYKNLDWKAIKDELASQKLSKRLTAHVCRRLEDFKTQYNMDVPLLEELQKTGKLKRNLQMR